MQDLSRYCSKAFRITPFALISSEEKINHRWNAVLFIYKIYRISSYMFGIIRLSAAAFLLDIPRYRTLFLSLSYNSLSDLDSLFKNCRGVIKVYIQPLLVFYCDINTNKITASHSDRYFNAFCLIFITHNQKSSKNCRSTAHSFVKIIKAS